MHKPEWDFCSSLMELRCHRQSTEQFFSGLFIDRLAPRHRPPRSTGASDGERVGLLQKETQGEGEMEGIVARHGEGLNEREDKG